MFEAFLRRSPNSHSPTAANPQNTTAKPANRVLAQPSPRDSVCEGHAQQIAAKPSVPTHTLTSLDPNRGKANPAKDRRVKLCVEFAQSYSACTKNHMAKISHSGKSTGRIHLEGLDCVDLRRLHEADVARSQKEQPQTWYEPVHSVLRCPAVDEKADREKDSRW